MNVTYQALSSLPTDKPRDRRSQKSFWLAWLSSLFIFLLSVTASASSALLPTRELQVGNVTAYVEVAATPDSRQKGLMFREQLAPDHGMLFVFDQPHYHCFWMKNTPLPLSIAFIDSDGVIINIEHMQPFSETQWCARKPAPYALEMPQGWFGTHGLRAGHTVTGLPSLVSR